MFGIAEKLEKLQIECNKNEFASRMQFFFLFAFSLSVRQAQAVVVPLTHSVQLAWIFLKHGRHKREHAMIYELKNIHKHFSFTRN